MEPTMQIKAEEIAKGLESLSVRPKKAKDPKGYNAWNAEDFYKPINDIGVSIVKDYFKEFSTELTGKVPWSALKEKNDRGVVINKFRSKWKAFAEKVLSDKLFTKVVKDKDGKESTVPDVDKIKQVKDAIYMGSQQLWLYEQTKKIKEVEKLSFEMKSKLIRLQNNDLKLTLIQYFYSKQTKKQNVITFVRLVNRTYYENKYCKQLLREKKKLEEQLSTAKDKGKSQSTEDKVVADVGLPTKPTIKTVVQAVKEDRIVEILTNPKYLNYVIDSKHFVKLANSATVLSVLDEWRKSKADMFNNFGDNLDLFYSAVKSASMLAKK
jgi:hypothetical protein